MKKFALAAALAATASTAFAGGLAPVVVEPEVIVEEAPASSMAGWLIPLIIVGVIIAVASSTSEDNNG